MKLEINLADRVEIAAAVALLQTVLDNTNIGGVQEVQTPPAVAPYIAVAAPLPTAPEGTAAAIFGATPPAFVPPAPVAPGMAALMAMAAAPVPLAPGVELELDIKGVPWDERIHASTKSKVQSGEWKTKRGVDPATIAAVEAEAGDAAAPFVLPVAPLAPALPVALLPSADPTTFEQLMPRVTAAIAAGLFRPTALGEICASHGLASIVTLQTNQQYVPLVWAEMKRLFPELS